MNYKKGELAVLLFNIIYTLIFTAYYIYIKNYEFLWYVAVLVFFIILLGATLHKTKFDYLILWGLSIWGLLHMAGGGVVINGKVLYALKIIPIIELGPEFFILKFDQFVHFFGFMVTALVIFHLLTFKLKNTKGFLPYFIAAIGSMGLGAVNEIVEFIAVVVFPETGVGGYYNTALDLVFNALGATLGALIAYLRQKSNLLKFN